MSLAAKPHITDPHILKTPRLSAGGSLMGKSVSTTRSLNYLLTLSGRQIQIFGFLSLREVLTSFIGNTSNIEMLCVN